jgi:hypothetical protein
MSQKEQTQAANALIEWFNSQEIGKADAHTVMIKVFAKLLISSPADTRTMREAFDRLTADLANECNNRAVNLIHGSRK